MRGKWTILNKFHLIWQNEMRASDFTVPATGTYLGKGKGKGKGHPCTGTEALYRPYVP